VEPEKSKEKKAKESRQGKSRTENHWHIVETLRITLTPRARRRFADKVTFGFSWYCVMPPDQIFDWRHNSSS